MAFGMNYRVGRPRKLFDLKFEILKSRVRMLKLQSYVL